MNLRKDAEYIVKRAIKRVLPDEAVFRALKQKEFGDSRVFVVSIGKAGWQMAKAAESVLGEQIEAGVVITKYNHVMGEIPHMVCYEGGHPVPDENSMIGTQAALELVGNLEADDIVLFLISGGGSALFEKPLVSEAELADITRQLLACGADIVEINTIRKRLSAVKGGKFAQICAPAQVYSIVLSDILGDPLDMIASGPACPDSSTCEAAIRILQKYQLPISEQARRCVEQETPKELNNVETVVTGSVKDLCAAAADACKELKYEPIVLTDQLNCEARGAGEFLAAIAKTYQNVERSTAFIAGGETVVHLKGKGLGGRNQELALAAAEGIAGLKNTAIFSVGSDGTDGPTDAAGGYCDTGTKNSLNEMGIDIYEVLEENDAYPALEKTKGLIITGPTGTNVNDVAVLLIKRGQEAQTGQEKNCD